MKNLILIFAVALFSTQLLSQDITYFFLNLPDSCLLDFSKQDRKKIVNNHSEVLTISQPYIFKAVDEKFGYLFGPFEMSVKIKIWELSNGDKLIAVHKSNGTLNVCYSEFHFYNYNGKKFKLLNNLDILPLEDIEPDFFSGNYEDNMNRIIQEVDYPICFMEDMSPKGSSIYVDFGLGSIVGRSSYEKYGIIGDRMELIWNDGKFTKGKVSWSERE
jgi:hypothetical protein